MWSKEEDRSTLSMGLIRGENGQGILDTLLVCILVGILIGTAIPYYQTLSQEAQEATLQAGLANIRKSIQLYHALQGSYPPDLRSLVNARYIIPIREDTFFSGEYLKQQAMNVEGDLLDPFGNRYRYNPKDGSVASTTEGFEAW